MNNRLSYTSLIYFILRATSLGISFALIVRFAKQDSWLAIIIGTIIGIIPVLLVEYIAKYESDKTFVDKIKIVFPKSYKIISTIMLIGFFTITIINFSNLTTLITSQFLSKTPNIVIAIVFIIPIALLITKDNKIIARVSLILFYASIFLFLMSLLGFLNQLDLSNLKPALTNPILPSAYYYLSFNIMPIFLILFFPNKDIIPCLKKGYLLSSITIFIIIITTLAILGPDLTLLYQYPQFHILKRLYQDFLTFRLENIFAVQFIFDIFIFCVVCLKNCNHLLNFHQGYKQIIIPIILLIITTLLFATNTVSYTNMIINISLIFSIFFAFLILLFSIKIFTKKLIK